MVCNTAYGKRDVVKQPSKRARGLNVYSNLAHKRRSKRDADARKRAEYLASLPKHPVQRLLYILQPKRVINYWFSKRGGIMALKILGVSILLLFLLVGGLFAYYRKDLDQIRPGELAKRVQTSVTKYYDRNGVLLWEDKGQGNYKLVVDGNDINPLIKQATVAIEDKDFYHHGGVSVTGIFRSLFNNLHGGDTQGGSTLTQQLAKQVFFADQAGDRGISGVPRKIKEMILAIEVERMYNKDQILDLYLNESPYGGRRNGVESGAQTYFGVSAKDLTLPQAALLAAIPNSPSLYDPYNTAGNPALIDRQHDVLDHMADQGYITKAQADEAKKFPIIDSIKPLSNQFTDIKAPHFVQYVRSQLEQSLGKATVGQGGLTVTTTLDSRIQDKLEESMTNLFKSGTPNYAGFTNGAATVEDTQTGQIVAMMGSRNYDYPGFGQDNAALAYIQPGSTIKPLVYSQLFSDQGADKTNYGSGSVLSDANDMQSIYGAPLYDADHKFMGDITIRKALALSRNVPAVKAMYVSGIDKTMSTIKAMGDSNYCSQGIEVQSGLSSAIGGCGTRMIDHVNAFASIGRMGVYKPVSTVLKVTNSQGEVIQEYKDQSKKIVDPQATYIVSDILADDNARAGLYGPHFPGLYIPGVRMSVKTGTSDKDGKPKDIWNVGYTPALTMAVWLGNSDTTPLTNGNSSLPAKVLGPVMEYAHKEIYAKDGRWNPADGGSWFTKPAGIQTIGSELYPSWYNKSKSQSGTKVTFDKVSKFKATSCTPDAARVDVVVTQMTDPITKNTTYTAQDGYDASQSDNVHNCSDVKPTISISSITGGNGTYTITATVTPGTNPVQTVQITVGGTSIPVTGSGTKYTGTYSSAAAGSQTVTATATDSVYYTGTDSTTQTFSSSGGH
jgi:penicillin-binding protein 1A